MHNSGVSRRENAKVYLDFPTSLRANGSRECAPDDRLREAIQFCFLVASWIASLGSQLRKRLFES
jgi:hypothetical protein